MLSLTSATSGALVGVSVSVTTVPAAADTAVSLALGGGGEVRRAALQPAVDLVGIVVAAVVTLALQRVLRRRFPRIVPRVETTARTRLRA